MQSLFIHPLIIVRTVRTATLPVLVLLRADFSGFRLAGSTCSTDKGVILQRGADAKLHLDRLKGVSLCPQNLGNLEFYQYDCP